MLVSTVLNLFFIPALYVILEGILSRFSRKKSHAQEALPATQH